jgi:DNA-binding MarR family transcriptional regulator
MDKAISITDTLDRVIHERARLGIMTILAAEDEAEFTALKRTLHLSDGNLNAHLKVLEKNGYITVVKEFVKNRPRTVYRVTGQGREAFEAYVVSLEKFLKRVSQRRGEDDHED